MSASSPGGATKFTLQEPCSGGSVITYCLVSVTLRVILQPLGSECSKGSFNLPIKWILLKTKQTWGSIKAGR